MTTTVPCAVCLLAALFVMALTVPSVSAYPDYQQYVPNGANVSRNGLAWPAIGHEFPNGPTVPGDPMLNDFGRALQSAGRSWYLLCPLDSDGDGYTNGEELGDPDCKWIHGQMAARQHGISHPAYNDSIPPPTPSLSLSTSITGTPSIPLPTDPPSTAGPGCSGIITQHIFALEKRTVQTWLLDENVLNELNGCYLKDTHVILKVKANTRPLFIANHVTIEGNSSIVIVGEDESPNPTNAVSIEVTVSSSTITTVGDAFSVYAPHAENVTLVALQSTILTTNGSSALTVHANKATHCMISVSGGSQLNVTNTSMVEATPSLASIVKLRDANETNAFHLMPGRHQTAVEQEEGNRLEVLHSTLKATNSILGATGSGGVLVLSIGSYDPASQHNANIVANWTSIVVKNSTVDAQFEFIPDATNSETAIAAGSILAVGPTASIATSVVNLEADENSLIFAAGGYGIAALSFSALSTDIPAAEDAVINAVLSTVKVLHESEVVTKATTGVSTAASIGAYAHNDKGNATIEALRVTITVQESKVTATAPQNFQLAASMAAACNRQTATLNTAHSLLQVFSSSRANHVIEALGSENGVTGGSVSVAASFGVYSPYGTAKIAMQTTSMKLEGRYGSSASSPTSTSNTQAVESYGVVKARNLHCIAAGGIVAHGRRANVLLLDENSWVSKFMDFEVKGTNTMALAGGVSVQHNDPGSIKTGGANPFTVDAQALVVFVQTWAYLDAEGVAIGGSLVTSGRSVSPEGMHGGQRTVHDSVIDTTNTNTLLKYVDVLVKMQPKYSASTYIAQLRSVGVGGGAVCDAESCTVNMKADGTNVVRLEECNMDLFVNDGGAIGGVAVASENSIVTLGSTPAQLGTTPSSSTPTTVLNVLLSGGNYEIKGNKALSIGGVTHLASTTAASNVSNVIFKATSNAYVLISNHSDSHPPYCIAAVGSVTMATYLQPEMRVNSVRYEVHGDSSVILQGMAAVAVGSLTYGSSSFGTGLHELHDVRLDVVASQLYVYGNPEQNRNGVEVALAGASFWKSGDFLEPATTTLIGREPTTAGLRIAACGSRVTTGSRWDLPTGSYTSRALSVGTTAGYATTSPQIAVQYRLFNSIIASEGTCVGVPLAMAGKTDQTADVVLKQLQFACVRGMGVGVPRAYTLDPSEQTVAPGYYFTEDITDHYMYKTDMMFNRSLWFPPSTFGFADQGAPSQPQGCPGQSLPMLTVATPAPTPIPTMAPTPQPPTPEPPSTPEPTEEPTEPPETNATRATATATIVKDTTEPAPTTTDPPTTEPPASTNATTAEPITTDPVATDPPTTAQPTPQPPASPCLQNDTTMLVIVFDLDGSSFGAILGESATTEELRVALTSDLESIMHSHVCAVELTAYTIDTARRVERSGVAVTVHWPEGSTTSFSGALAILPSLTPHSFTNTQVMYRAFTGQTSTDIGAPQNVGLPTSPPTPQPSPQPTLPNPSTPIPPVVDTPIPTPNPPVGPPGTPSPTTDGNPHTGDKPKTSLDDGDSGNTTLVIIVVAVVVVVVILMVICGVCLGLRHHKRKKQKYKQAAEDFKREHGDFTDLGAPPPHSNDVDFGMGQPVGKRAAPYTTKDDEPEDGRGDALEVAASNAPTNGGNGGMNGGRNGKATMPSNEDYNKDDEEMAELAPKPSPLPKQVGPLKSALKSSSSLSQTFESREGKPASPPVVAIKTPDELPSPMDAGSLNTSTKKKDFPPQEEDEMQRAPSASGELIPQLPSEASPDSLVALTRKLSYQMPPALSKFAGAGEDDWGSPRQVHDFDDEGNDEELERERQAYLQNHPQEGGSEKKKSTSMNDSLRSPGSPVVLGPVPASKTRRQQQPTSPSHMMDFGDDVAANGSAAEMPSTPSPRAQALPKGNFSFTSAPFVESYGENTEDATARDGRSTSIVPEEEGMSSHMLPPASVVQQADQAPSMAVAVGDSDDEDHGVAEQQPAEDPLDLDIEIGVDDDAVLGDQAEDTNRPQLE